MAFKVESGDGSRLPSHAEVELRLVAREERQRHRHIQEQHPPGRQALDHRHIQRQQHIAHVPLEPRAAVAEWEDGKLTVWTGTQRPFGVRGELATAFGVGTDKVRVIVPDMGSGYGGKHTGEAAVEAARLAKAAKKPVKLVWTREEEFTWADFRPGGVIDITAGVKKDGTLTSWEAHNWNSGASSGNRHSERLMKHLGTFVNCFPLST